MGKLLIIWKSASIGLHIIGTIAYSFAIIYKFFQPMSQYKDPRNSFMGDFKFMTYWNLLFECLFNCLSLLCDVIPNKRLNSKIVKHMDTFFHIVVFTLSMFVCTAFWFLSSVYVNLMRHPIIGNLYKRWYNHVTHTMIAPINILELMITYHEEPQPSHGIIVLLALYLLYFSWVIFLGIYIDLWVYAFLGTLSWPQRITFAIVCGLSLIFYQIGGVYINKLFWPKQRIKSFRKETN